MIANSTRPKTLRQRLSRAPWWFVAFVVLGSIFMLFMQSDETYSEILRRVGAGIQVTVFVTLVAYILALILGLLIGLARTSRNTLIYQTATFYVELIRGIPMLVLLFYIAFVAGPEIIVVINALGRLIAPLPLLQEVGQSLAEMTVRDLSFMARAIMALTIGYSAFLSEVFRAGIESIEVGQWEAARSLGMTRFQVMRYVILPQAIRNVLPPLGNNFIAMLKDSSLVSVVGVRDITRVGDTYATGSFRYFEAFTVVAFVYLVMTLLLSLGVRYLERRLSQSRQNS